MVVAPLGWANPRRRVAPAGGEDREVLGMEFRVVFVGEDELPGKDWAIVRAGGVFYAFIKAARMTAALLTEMWRAFAGFAGAPGVEIPAPRWETVPAAYQSVALAV